MSDANPIHRGAEKWEPEALAVEPEVAEAFYDMWADIVKPGGQWDHDQVMRELYDYKMLLDNVPKVYDHVTGGRVSKPNTLASAVQGQADEYLASEIRERVWEAVDEVEAEDLDLIEGESMYDGARDALVYLASQFGPPPAGLRGNEQP